MPTTQLLLILKPRLPVALGVGALVLASSVAHALAPPPPPPAPPVVHVGGRDDLRAAQEELRRYREGEKREAAEFERRDVLDQQRVREQMRRDAEAKRAADEDAARQWSEDWQKRAAEQKQQDDQKRAAREKAEAESQASLQRRIAESERRTREEDDAMRERFAAIKRERAKPENILSKAYANYIGVRRCQASRTGRALVYVDDRESADAKAQVKDIESRIMQANPSLDREALWARATQSDDILWTISRSDIENGELTENGRTYCRGALAGIKQQYLDLNPEAGMVRKDF